MTHEWLDILKELSIERSLNKPCVLASLVDLEGSSYRKPGVRLLIKEDFSYVGSLSAGCLETYVAEKSKYVFENNQALLFQFDGNNGIGCGGTLTILLEPIDLKTEKVNSIITTISERKEFEISSLYDVKNPFNPAQGSCINIDNYSIPLFSNQLENKHLDFKEFIQPITSIFKLIILGSETDAFVLKQFAEKMKWEVVLVNSNSRKHFSDQCVISFPSLYDVDEKYFENSAAIIMNHNFDLDLDCLKYLVNKDLLYLGVLGPNKRKAELLNMLASNIIDNQKIHGPVGISIQAETPEEISISILAELIPVSKLLFIKQHSSQAF